MSNQSEIVIYQSDDGRIRLETRLENETLWMTQSKMADLFGCSADNISLHLKNIFEESELIEKFSGCLLSEKEYYFSDKIINKKLCKLLKIR